MESESCSFKEASSNWVLNTEKSGWELINYNEWEGLDKRVGLIKCTVPCNACICMCIIIVVMLLPSHESVLRVEAIVCLTSAGSEV